MGGYQVHLTLENPQEATNILKTFGTELITIENHIPGSLNFYTEYITSNNYKNLSTALVDMSKLALSLSLRRIKVLRQKIESNPKNQDDPMYTEIHYKVDSFDRSLENHCFFSKNKKGTIFATERFFGKKIVPRMPNYVREDVIYDSNLQLDSRLDRSSWYK